MFPLPDTYNPTGTFFFTCCNHPSVCLSIRQLVLKMGCDFTFPFHPCRAWCLVSTGAKIHRSPSTLCADRRDRFSIHETTSKIRFTGKFVSTISSRILTKEFKKALHIFFFLFWFSKSENYLGGILNDFKVKKRETSLISCNQLCHVQLQQALGVCVSCFPRYFTSSARESFPVQVLEHLSCRIWDMAAEGQAQKEKVGGRTKPKQLSQSTQ